MVYIIWFILGILALLFKKNKYITALIFLFITIIFCFNTSNPDLLGYQRDYITRTSFSTEPIFVFIRNLFSWMGLSFEVFRGFLTILGVGLITKTFYQLSPYPTLALFMYSIYPMAIDVVQIRSFMGCAIVFFSLKYLINYQDTHKRGDVIAFFIGILVATGFHYSMALFLILGLMVLDIRKHRFIYLILIPAMVIAALSAIDRLEPIVSYVIGSRKADVWVASGRSISMLGTLRILLSRAMPLLFALVLMGIRKSWRYIEVCGKSNDDIGLLGVEFCYDAKKDPYGYHNPKINRCLFISMFYIWLFSILEVTIAGDYERLARLGLLIAIALLTRQLFYLEKRNRLISTVLFLGMYLLYFAMIMYVMEGRNGVLFIDCVFRRVIESNRIFGITYH